MAYRTLSDLLEWTEEASNGCLEWMRALDKDGYAAVFIGGKNLRGHRVAYGFAHGSIPDGLHVLHNCDNRRCINPEHLRLGTNDDNVADRVARDRTAKGERNGRYTKPEAFSNAILRGEKNGASVITAGDAMAIREMPGSSRYLARKFGLSQSQIQNIKHHRSWAHV